MVLVKQLEEFNDKRTTRINCHEAGIEGTILVEILLLKEDERYSYRLSFLV